MNIYVGNLPFTTTEEELRGIFEAYGEVETVKIILDRETGKPRGFGFVDMPDDAAANAAIAALNDKEYMERNLKVNEARPRTEGDRPRKTFNRGGGGGGFNRGGGGGFSGNRY